MTTLVGVILLVHLAFPLGMFAFLGAVPARSRAEGIIRVAMVGTFCAYLFLAGQWCWFSYYLRFALVAAYVIIAAAACEQLRRVRLAGRDTTRERIFMALETVALTFFLWFFLRALAGHRYAGEPILLRFPLDEGVSYVSNGGSTDVLNLHARVPTQHHGIDIVQLNAFGARANGLYPGDLTGYVIYGRPVRAPCDGTVLGAVDGLADLTPPATDTQHPAGNYVVIACGRTTVVMAHLGRGSVRVSRGDNVGAGDPIGRVGNSGLTTEPHLHVHAFEGRPADPMRDGRPVPMLFDGRYLVRNSVVRP